MLTYYPLVVLCGLSVYSHAQDSRTIFQYLQDEQYTKLVDLIEKAGIRDEFMSTSTFPITLFAPTDAAFRGVSPAFLTSLQNNVTFLRNILNGHVADEVIIGMYIRDNVTKRNRLGTPLVFNVYTNGVKTVNGARLGGDVILSNGALHSVDKVLVPLNDSMAATVAESDPEFRDLFGFLILTRLYDTLTTGGPYTLFAPTDAAFLHEDVVSLVRNITALEELLKQHVVSGAYWSAGLTDGLTLNNLAGSQLQIHIASGLSVNTANVIIADLGAKNGVIHVVDSVIKHP